VDKNQRKTIEGWLDKASNHLAAARENLKSYYHYSESIQSSQQCVELSVKALLVFLGVDFPRSHGWNRDEFARIAEQIQDRQLLDKLVADGLGHIRLPRLLFLANFWAQFYLQAKYGLEAAYLASAQQLFDKEDAELAARHADECLRAANTIRFLDDARLAAMVS
jgi:HEPN domain-containing protein